MEVEFINQINKATIGCACLILAGYTFCGDLLFGLGIFTGALWAVCNLFFIKMLIISLLDPKLKDPLKGFLLIGVKFPLLYTSGYCILQYGGMPVESILLGFSLLFCVTLLKSVHMGITEAIKNKEGSKPV